MPRILQRIIGLLIAFCLAMGQLAQGQGLQYIDLVSRNTSPLLNMPQRRDDVVRSQALAEGSPWMDHAPGPVAHRVRGMIGTFVVAATATGAFIGASTWYDSISASFAGHSWAAALLAMWPLGWVGGSLSQWISYRTQRIFFRNPDPLTFGIYLRSRLFGMVFAAPIYVLMLTRFILLAIERHSPLPPGWFGAAVEVPVALLFYDPLEFALGQWFISGLPWKAAFAQMQTHGAGYSIWSTAFQFFITLIALVQPHPLMTYAVILTGDILVRAVYFFALTSKPLPTPAILRRSLAVIYGQPWFKVWLFSGLGVLYAILAVLLAAPWISLVTPFLGVGLLASTALFGHHQWPRRMVTDRLSTALNMADLQPRIARELDSVRAQISRGASWFSILMRRRVQLERLHGHYLDILNKGRDPFGKYVMSMRGLLGDKDHRLKDWLFQHTDWIRLIDQYWELLENRPSPRLLAISALNLPRPSGPLPVLNEHPRYGILLLKGRKLHLKEPPEARSVAGIVLCDRSGQAVRLRLQRFTSDDLHEIGSWIQPHVATEVDYDLKQFLSTGLQAGEYGYKLIREDSGAIEGFTVLVAADSHVHIHITYKNPFTQPEIVGIGIELTKAAIQDAQDRNVPVTTFPTSPEARRKNLRLGFRRVAVEGRFSSEMWVLFPREMDSRTKTRRLLDWLPPASAFELLTALRPGWGRRFRLHDVSFQELEHLMISHGIFNHYATDVEALRKRVMLALQAYWQIQDAHPGNPILLQERSGGVLSPVVAPRPRRKNQSRTSPLRRDA